MLLKRLSHGAGARALALSLALLSAAASTHGPRPALAAARPGGQHPELALQTAHATEATAAAFSPDGRTVVTGGDDGRVKFWDASSGELKRTLNAHRGPASAVAFTHDGRLLVTAGWDMTVKLWDARGGQPAGTLPNPDGVTFMALDTSRDGKVAAGGLGRPASESEPALTGEILVWDLGTRTLRRSIREGGGEVSALAFSPDGAALASGGADPLLKLWDANTGTLVRGLAGHASEITSVAFSPDGRAVASGSRDGLVKIWEPATGALRRDVQGEQGERNQLAFSRADGSLLVGNSELKSYNPSDGGVLRSFERATLRTTAVSVAPDGRLAVCVGLSKVEDGTPNEDVPLFDQAHVWDARTGRFLRRMDGYLEGVTAVAASSAGLLAAAGFDRVVRLWDARDGRVLRALLHPMRVWSVAFSPDARTLAVATGNMASPGVVVLRDVATGELKRKLRGHTLPARAVAFTHDGGTLASGGEDGAVRLWNPETGATLKTLSDGTRPVFALNFSPDGARIATGSFDHKVRLWDVRTGALVRTLTGHRESVFAVAFSPDGTRLASGSKDRRIKIWDAASGADLLTLDTAALRVTGLFFFDEGRKLAAGNDDGSVTVWNAFTGQRLLKLVGHELGVTGVAQAPGGAGIYSGAADNTVRLWDSSTGELRATLYSLRPGEAGTGTPTPPSVEGHFPPPSFRTDFVASTPEGFYSASPQAERLARFRVGNDLSQAESFQGPYLRPEQLSRALAGEPTQPGPALKGPLPPLVGFTSHRDGDAFSGDALDLTLAATDDGKVVRVTIFIDGTPLSARLVKLSAAAAAPAPQTSLGLRGIPGGHSLSHTVTARVPISARRRTLRLRAVAHDDAGLQSRTEEITITRR